MDVRAAITTRRTVKSFKPDPIPRERLLDWMQDAAMAPNHRMTEPWSIRWIGPETRAALAHKADFFGAPTVFAVLSHRGTSSLERDENLVATACFLQNFLLLVHASGAAAFWSSIGASPANAEKLEVTEAFDVVGVVAVGWPEAVPAAKPRASIASKIVELP